MLTTLHILYTHGLNGDLARLPRLYTAIQQLEEQMGIRALRLDLGDACAPTIWHCAATEGRSMAMALDVMGYHAVNVTGMTEASRFKLRGVASLGLVDAQHAWRYNVAGVTDESLLVSSVPTSALRLCILLAPAPETHLTNGILSLQPAPPHHIGYVQIDLTDEPRLIESGQAFPLEKNARPDPTITAALELIEEEARSYQRRDS
jgi:hypothetical protein